MTFRLGKSTERGQRIAPRANPGRIYRPLGADRKEAAVRLPFASHCVHSGQPVHRGPFTPLRTGRSRLARATVVPHPRGDPSARTIDADRYDAAMKGLSTSPQAYTAPAFAQPCACPHQLQPSSLQRTNWVCGTRAQHGGRQSARRPARSRRTGVRRAPEACDKSGKPSDDIIERTFKFFFGEKEKYVCCEPTPAPAPGQGSRPGLRARADIETPPGLCLCSKFLMCGLVLRLAGNHLA